MKRTLRLSTSIEAIEDSQGQWAISWEIAPEVLEQWCLEVCLLAWDLSEELTVTGPKTSFEVILRRKARSSKGERPKKTRFPIPKQGAMKNEESRAIIELHFSELADWLSFFLQYYRDGIANVNHIDVELEALPKEHKYHRGYLTIKIPDAYTKPRISVEELKEELGF